MSTSKEDTEKYPCGQGYARSLLYFIALYLIVGVGSASFNITIQSANPKDINLIRISDFSNVASIGNNQTTSMPYDNYVLQFGANVSTISWTNFFGNLTKMQSDGLIIALIFLIIVLAYNFAKWVEQ